MKKYMCKSPGCGILLDKNGYCPKHRIEKERNKTKPFVNAVRSNEELYRSPEWRVLKKRILSDMPFCCYCGIGKNESRLEVHHVRAPRGDVDSFLDYSNVVSVCPECHRRITAMEITNRKRKI
jgi:5-methylcytosine-specific restriction endonuclease McrA